VTAWSDRRAWLATGAALFVLGAWPLVLVELPPLQDLPNHVASAFIARHPARYPDLAFNGLWKSNALLELWLSRFDDLRLGARLFTALAIAAGAFGLPWVVLELAGRRALRSASLLLWPLVHGFFVAMGMLNFAIAFPLAMIVLVGLERQRAAPSVARGARIAALALVTWYAHPFPLIVVGGLAAVELATGRAARREAGRAGLRTALATLAPLVPAGALVLGTALDHLIKATPAAAVPAAWPTVWDLVAQLWLHGAGPLTRWGSATVVPVIALAILAWRQRGARPAMLGGWGVALLAASYAGLPLMASNWWYLDSRLVPFLWLAAAVRAPAQLPRGWAPVLAACAVASSLALGVDYVRLDRDRAELAAGVVAVPDGATLLPLLFEHRRTSDFTASLTHAWADYVLERRTSAPLVFAVERSYALTYRDFPPAALIPPALDRFAELHATPATGCPAGSLPTDCDTRWRLAWAQLWAQAEPRFSHVLAWAMPPEAHAMLPARYHRVFAAGALEIFARR